MQVDCNSQTRAINLLIKKAVLCLVGILAIMTTITGCESNGAGATSAYDATDPSPQRLPIRPVLNTITPSKLEGTCLYACVIMFLGYTNLSRITNGSFPLGAFIAEIALSWLHPSWDSNPNDFNREAPGLIPGIGDRTDEAHKVTGYMETRLYPGNRQVRYPSILVGAGENPSHPYNQYEKAKADTVWHCVVVSGMETKHYQDGVVFQSAYIMNPNSIEDKGGYNTVVLPITWWDWISDNSGNSEYMTVNPPGGHASVSNPPSASLSSTKGTLKRFNSVSFIGTGLQPNTDYQIGSASGSSVVVYDKAKTDPWGKVEFNVLLNSAWVDNSDLGVFDMIGNLAIKSRQTAIETWDGVYDKAVHLNSDGSLDVTLLCESNLPSLWCSIQSSDRSIEYGSGSISTNGGHIVTSSAPSFGDTVTLYLNPIPPDGFGITKGTDPKWDPYYTTVVVK